MSGVGQEGAALWGGRGRARAPAPPVSMAEEGEDYEEDETEEEEGGGRKRARKPAVKKGVSGGSVTLAKPLQGPAKALRDAYDFQTVPDASIGALCARLVATGMMPAGAAGGSAVRAWFAKEEGERLTRQGKSAPPPLREAAKECRLCHKHRLVSHALAANTRPWDCSLPARAEEVVQNRSEALVGLQRS